MLYWGADLDAIVIMEKPDMRRWLGCEVVLPISFQHLILPQQHPPFTPLLSLQVSALDAVMLSSYEWHLCPSNTQTQTHTHSLSLSHSVSLRGS